jgi:hypothetical protein
MTQHNSRSEEQRAQDTADRIEQQRAEQRADREGRGGIEPPTPTTPDTVAGDAGDGPTEVEG